MEYLPVLLLIFSITLLFFGAEFTLNAAEKIGQKFGLSPFIIGMVLVGFGTSLPEMFVGHIAALKNQGSMALGSLIGSNIANMFLILGVCGVVSRLHLADRNVRRHLFIHLSLGFALFFVLKQNSLTLITVIPLFAVCLTYLFVIAREMKAESEEKLEVEDSTLKLVFILCIGFSFLFAGGDLLVSSGTDLAKLMGISEYIISAIFIAFGTSFPELVTALMAVIKKKDTGLIVGNIIGSNLFNCALILASLGVYDISLSEGFEFELYMILIGSIVLCLLNLFKKPLSLAVGGGFLGLYVLTILHWTNIL